MDRLAYLIRRLLLVIPTFIGITIICFSLTRFLPGGPVELKLMKMRGMGGGGEAAAAAQGTAASVTDDYRKELERQYGFDKPIYEQYWQWLVTNRMGMKLES